jgi:hypothetical protein
MAWSKNGLAVWLNCAALGVQSVWVEEIGRIAEIFSVGVIV